MAAKKDCCAPGSGPLPLDNRITEQLRRSRPRFGSMPTAAHPDAENEDGADGGTRTRIPFREADFRTTSAFAAASSAFVVWTIPSPRPSDRRRHPSSLYTFPGGAWLGIGLGRTLSFPRL